MDIVKVAEYIGTIEESLAALKREISLNPHVNVKVNGPAVVNIGEPAPRPEVKAQARPEPTPQFADVFGYLNSDLRWPYAIEPDMLADVNTREDMIDRAEQIMEFTIDCNLEDLNFLDYGCGDGYVAWRALDRGVAKSVGYDIKPSEVWSSFGKDSRLSFTADPGQLESAAFDVVFMYDVLDHSDDPQEVMYHVAKLLKPNGIVYVRCHPWTSRHGGHLYKKLNKAYAHLILDDATIAEKELSGEYVRKVVRPVRNYRQWFDIAGLKIRKEKLCNETLENYFRNNPVVWRAIVANFAEEQKKDVRLNDAAIAQILEISFVDYVLQINSIY